VASVAAPSRLLGPALRAGAVALAGVVTAVPAAYVVAARPDLLRILFAAALAVLLVVLCFVRPRAAAVAALLFLPFLALSRRLLIADAGWAGGGDPLILVGPIVVLALVVRLFVVERRPVAPDRLSALVLAMLVVALLGVANPAGPGLTAGLAGLLFVGIPLLWFFVGRELADEALVRALLGAVVVVATAIACYGLWQSEVGLPSWDVRWTEVAGYNALNVGDSLRPFGTFSSSAEYALFIGSALTICLAFALHRRGAYLLAMPVLATALFLASTRGALLAALVGAIVVIGLRTRRAGTSLAVVLLGIVISVGAITAFGPRLQQAASAGGNDLVTHQVGGITDPLNSDTSTLGLHWELVVAGFRDGFVQPLGRGTGATNQAADKFGGGDAGGAQGTEVDVTDAFRGFGLPGGVLYLTIIGFVGAAGWRAYRGGHLMALAVVGLLVATLGQWLTGAHYALAPLTWFLVGWITSRAWPRKGPQRATGLRSSTPA